MTEQKTWLVTGVAGFIGSHLAGGLLERGQKVVGLDDLSSGHKENISHFSADFTFTEGDIRSEDICNDACSGVDYVLHHAAIGSVVKSIEEPELVDQVNRAGCAKIMQAACDAGVKRVVYASSSAVYGDKDPNSLRSESEPVAPLSPYAETKCANEQDAQKFWGEQGLETVGLRYFNIYGPKQDPNGAYAAVIPKWINAMINNEPIEIYGDGETVRDFCFIDDVVRANIMAATADVNFGEAVYNIAAGQGTTLNELFGLLKDATGYKGSATYGEYRAGDIKVSQADISKAQTDLKFVPSVSMAEGLKRTVEWYKGLAHGG